MAVTPPSLPAILIALGANLPTAQYGPPRQGLEAALAALEAAGVRVAARSRWYESPPDPPSDQPWYVNGVARVETTLTASALLALLHEIEAAFGRQRRVKNAARVLDLDLLAYGERIKASGPPPRLPHPRLRGRAFVLLPLAEVAPDWRHPESGESVTRMIAALGPPGGIRPLAGES